MAKYTMTISRNTIDKLGVKLYDKAADVISELISNAYDADAEKVTIDIPLNVFLATKKNGKIVDKGFTISVSDDGHGMDAEDANNFYLKVGTDRRNDDARKTWGKKSPEKKRPVMGRKGIGKLASFGICKKIEIWSAGGQPTSSGKYKISNFIMNFGKIKEDTDNKYEPEIGAYDGKLSHVTGTKIILTDFLFRGIPDKDTFMRQLSKKFGLGTTDFQVTIHDTQSNTDYHVSEMDLPIIKRTKIILNRKKIHTGDGKSYPVSGWIAYSSTPYSNEEMAGIRIYARGKLAAVTRDFGHKSGFTGEYTIRSYLVGVIHADWLDEDQDEDLIASDRQDILWSSIKGISFKEWGQELLKELGKKSVGPLRERTYEVFLKKSKFEKEAKKRFGNTKVFDTAMKVGKALGSRADRTSLNDPDYVKSLLELILSIAPHSMIVEKLQEIATEGNQTALELVGSLLGDAKLAETASLGQIATIRINAIDNLENAVHQHPPPKEDTLQRLLENAPWLVEPEWTVLQSNQTFETFRNSFESWYYKQTKEKIITSFSSKNQNKRPDFIMLQSGRSIEIIEIKPPEHKFDDKDLNRFYNYMEKIDDFREKNKNLSKMLPDAHYTLICDEVNLSRDVRKGFEAYVDEGTVSHKTWNEALTDTKQAHEDFLKIRNLILKESSKNT